MKKAEFPKRFGSKCQLSVLVPIVLLVGLGPQASAKKAPTSENSRLSLQVYNAGVASHVLAPSGARLTLGFILASWLAKLGYNAAAGSPQSNPTVTIHVHNYAKVPPKTLTEAEKVAAEIFRKAGVETRWVNEHPESENKMESSDPKLLYPDIRLSILTRAMVERVARPTGSIGFAPGVGPDRQQVYVFYHRVEELARRYVEAGQEHGMRGVFERDFDFGHILGHVIAQELGHLLGLETHSPTGIMRADWNLAELQEAAHGYLLFTPQQAEIVRDEVRRRIRQQETGGTAPKTQPERDEASDQQRVDSDGWGLTRRCQGVTADALETDPTITMNVYNYAEVSPKTLMEAEKVATGIFRKAGVKTRWLDIHLSSKTKQEDSADPGLLFHSSDIALRILPGSMTESFRLTGERFGFAPGQGPNRSDTYVFYDRTEQLVEQQRAAQLKDALVGIVEFHASMSQILGHVIAHELGHLLGFETHSPTGIMRANWNSADLQNSIYGRFLFTLQQGEILRAEVNRRIVRQETIQQDRTDLKPRAEQNSVQGKRN